MNTIHLDQETDRRLAELATATSKQPEDIVKKALQAYLEDLEGIEGQCLLQRIDKEGTECAVSLDEIS